MVEPKDKEVAVPCLSVVMAAYNEVSSVVAVARKVLDQQVVQELIVVDDGSSDGTWEALHVLQAEAPRVQFIRHECNKGKGAALRTGFAHAKAPIVIVQDADLEYDPVDYSVVLQPILSGKADVVFGSRFLGSGAHRVLYFWHAVGNRILTTLSNMATNLNLSDMETCYKAFKQEVLQKITVEEDRFGFEPEIIAKVSRLGVRIYEVPISYYGRTYAEGKKVNWRDGISALRCIIKYNFFPRRS